MADKNKIDPAFKGMIKAAEGPANYIAAYAKAVEKQMKAAGFKKR